MEMAKKIKMLLAARGMSVKDLADKLGTTSQNLNKKLKRSNFSENDLRFIAEVCEASFIGLFKLNENGNEI